MPQKALVFQYGQEAIETSARLDPSWDKHKFATTVHLIQLDFGGTVETA
jgi:hypothetical protein